MMLDEKNLLKSYQAMMMLIAMPNYKPKEKRKKIQIK